MHYQIQKHSLDCIDNHIYYYFEAYFQVSFCIGILGFR